MSPTERFAPILSPAARLLGPARHAPSTDLGATAPAEDPEATDLAAHGVHWDLEPLLEERDVEQWLDEADRLAGEIEAHRGGIAGLDPAGLAGVMATLDSLHEALGRAGNYASLHFAVDTTDEARGARMQKVEERTTAVANRILFLDLEWAALDDDRAEALLDDERLAFCAHHLRSLRRYRPHLLSEPEERILADKHVTGASAWARLFSELTSALSVELSDGDGTRTAGLEEGLSLLTHPDRVRRRQAAEAVTAALEPGLRTRAFVFNTLLADKATDDRLRHHATWISSRNLANEASDASVEALVEAVVDRYEVARRWYRLKARMLGVDRLADYDRMASVSATEATMGWSEARELVLDSYTAFSPTLGDEARRFFEQAWIDAPVQPGKRPGAFCAYTVPSHHPYLFLNWTGRPGDALTLAHELGHGLHAWLARGQGSFHQSTPLTLAETASVFGETLTFGRLLDRTTDADVRLDLLARSVEGAIATVFRQVAMNRFEHAVHLERRDHGELTVARFGELWAASQGDLLGDAVEVTEGYRSWWSYIPHFIATPGYVYAYAYGQLLALSVYARYQQEGEAFVPDYLELLAAGGSRPPEELGRMVGCDLEDPGFWTQGLALVEAQVDAAEQAAHDAGRL
jgi:oligoendopeptidase F